jgi:hypothetical protein
VTRSVLDSSKICTGLLHQRRPRSAGSTFLVFSPRSTPTSSPHPCLWPDSTPLTPSSSPPDLLRSADSIFLTFGLRSTSTSSPHPRLQPDSTPLAPSSMPGQPDERLVPDLPRGRGKSIGGDLDIDEEGFGQNDYTTTSLHSLHHGSVGYQHVCTQVGLAQKAYPYKCNREYKKELERTQLNLQMND